MDKRTEKIKRNDRILLGGLLLLAILSGVGVFFYQRITTHDAAVVIKVNDVEIERHSLSKDNRIKIPSENGGYNILVIKDGYAKMQEASCPDKICVHHSRINRNGQTIVCLPNQVVIEIQSQDESDIDGSTN